MKIAYNPKTAAVITAATAANDDILFDLNARKVWAKGLRMGADWADISSKPSSLKNPYAIKFRDINGNKVSYDGSSAKDLTTGTYIAKLPYGFSSFSPEPTWGNTTGTSIASWNDSSGGSIDFRKDNPVSGKLSIKVDGRVYVNEGANPVLSAESNNGYWGIRTPDGGNDWIRTPDNGLIPCVKGNAGSGHSSLGTSTWYFSTAYIDKVYGSLKGNADTATTATKATNAENADKLDGWHKDNILWTGWIEAAKDGLSSYWFKMYEITLASELYNDYTITFLVGEAYSNSFSIFYLRVRQNGANGSGAYNLLVSLHELVGNLKNKIIAYYNNKTGNVLLWGNIENTWRCMNFTILKKAIKGASDKASVGTLTALSFTTVQTQPTTDYTKVTMSRVGLVQYAESASSSTLTTKLQTARSLWGNSFDGTKDINGSIVFTTIGDTGTSSKISWSGSSDGADIYYLTTARDLGNLVLNVKDDTNAYILLALKGVFKSHFDVANSYWTGRSALADKWTTARTFTIGNTAKNVDGSGNVSWSLAEIGVRDTWRTVQVNGTSIGNNTLNLCGSAYIGLTNVDGKVTFSLVGSSTTANQAILSNGTVNGWTLKTLNIANWDTAYNLRHTHANKSVLDGITTGSVTNWNTAYTFVSTITGKDTDDVINKWDEIVNFLAGIKDDNKLNTLLGSKLSVYKLADKTNVGAIKNNGIYYSTSDASSGTLTNSPFNKGFTLINMTSIDNGEDLRRSRLAFNAFGEIKVSDDRDEANTAETWYNVLTSKNSGISGSTIKLNGTSITVYSSDTADGRYVKKSGDTMTGALNFANNIWNQVGNDVAIGDHNVAGCLGIKGLNAGPGLVFYNSSNTLLSTLVGTANLFLRISGDNVFNILDTSSTYVSNGKGVINGSTITQVDNATNANKVDNYHIADESRQVYRNYYTVDNPAGAWILIKFPAWNVNNEIVAIDGYGNNRQAHCVVHCGSGNQDIWGYQSFYNCIVVSKIRWKEVDSGKFAIVALIDDGITTLTIKATNSLEISKTTEDNAAFTISSSFFSSSGVFHGNVDWDKIIGKPSTFNPAAHTHTVFKNNLMIKGTNGISDSASIHLGIGDSNTGFKWISDGVCQIYANNVAVGEWTSGGMNWFENPTVNGNKVWNAGNDGSGSGLDADTVDGYHANGLLTALSNSNNGISITVGGTTKSVSNISVNYANSSGSASSTTKVIVTQHTADDVNYPLVWSNLANTNTVTENQLYKSWKDLYYNPKNKRLTVAGSVSTAYVSVTKTVTSAGFKHSAVTKNANLYVLTADGGYTFLNLTSNELAHEFDVNITVTSEWADIEDFYGGNLSFLTLSGTYIVLVYYTTNSANSMYEGYFSGIMSWYTGKTNSNNADEIVLHRVGHAYANTIYLRTRESLISEANPYTKLQISANSDLKQHTYKFKFKRIC